MTTLTITEAQKRLPDLLAAAQAGEKVIIQGDKGQTFALVPLVSPDWPGYPQPGSAKGLIKMTDSFDEPLDELKEYME